MTRISEALRPTSITERSSDVDTASPGRVRAAYDAIRHAIRSNVFPPGYQAAEVEIARQLGMSRTPVHEAMARLQEDGLVRILPKKGIIIRGLSSADIDEIYEVTIALEGAAAARMAGFLPKERNRLSQILREATSKMGMALAAGDLQAWARADEEFHQHLVTHCGNRRIMRMAGTVADQLHRARIFTLNLRPLPISSTDDHIEIIERIEQGDARLASQAARNHRQHARDQILPLIARLNLTNL